MINIPTMWGNTESIMGVYTWVDSSETYKQITRRDRRTGYEEERREEKTNIW